MLLLAFLLRRHPASDMRLRNGYYTPTSRKSKAHWDYAQKIAPDIFQHYGKVFLIAEILLGIVFFAFDIDVIVAVITGTITGFCGLFLCFWKTEKGIKENFPE